MKTKGHKYRVHFIFTALLALTIIVGFQNCSDVGFESGDLTNQCAEGMCGEEYLYYEVSSDVKGDKYADILFVIDYSPSMSPERNELAAKFSGLTDVLEAEKLNFRLAVTSTTLGVGSGEGYYGDLYQIKPGQYYLSNSDNGYLTDFENIITPNKTIDDFENGIENAINAIDKNQNNWMRDKTNLEVVVLSDEDVCNNGCPYANLVTDFQSAAKRNGKNASFHSIIIPEGDSECYSYHNSGDEIAHYGNTYQSLSQASGGQVESICADNYSDILAKIGNNIKNGVLSTIHLKCSNGDRHVIAIKSLNIFENKEAYQNHNPMLVNYSLKGDSIEFANELPVDTIIEARFVCGDI